MSPVVSLANLAATMHALLQTHREQLLALAHSRGMSNVRLFGSMGRGDAGSDSDVDLLVTLAPGVSALALGRATHRCLAAWYAAWTERNSDGCKLPSFGVCP